MRHRLSHELDTANPQTQAKKSLKQQKQPSLIRKVLHSVSSALIMLFALLVLVLAYFLVTRLGVGKSFPPQPYTQSNAVLPPESLQLVAELPIPPGNIAVSRTGRVFFNFHPEYGPKTVKVAELRDKHNWAAYPDMVFQKELITCLSMRIDSVDRLWLLDFALHGMQGQPKLFAFDLLTNTRVHEFSFPADIAGFGSMLNDFQVDVSGDFIFIADTSVVAANPAIVVYDVRKRQAHRIFSGHSSLYGPSIILQPGGSPVSFAGVLGLRIHVDSIALDRTGSTLYFGALTGDKLYSVSTSHLLYYLQKQQELGPRERAAMLNNIQLQILEVAADKPATDGLTTDASGNVWMTALEHSSIALAVPVSRKLEKGLEEGVADRRTMRMINVVQDEGLLRWPDGLSFGPDGLYITCSALNLKLSGKLATTAELMNAGPYHILRLNSSSLAKLSDELQVKIALPTAGQ